MTFETFDQGDEETWPGQLKDNEKGKDNDSWRTPSKSNPRDMWPLRHTDYIPNNWVQQSQHSDPWSKSDRDSISNYCDVFFFINISSELKYIY